MPTHSQRPAKSGNVASFVGKWKLVAIPLDSIEFVERLKSLDRFSCMAVADAVERFWSGAYHQLEVRERLRKVGLVKGEQPKKGNTTMELKPMDFTKFDKKLEKRHAMLQASADQNGRVYLEFPPLDVDSIRIISVEEYAEELPANYRYEQVSIPGNYASLDELEDWVAEQNLAR